MKRFVEFKNVIKTYKIGNQNILACDNINFQINEGEFCIIVGPSGAGKTTLLNLLGGMEQPNSGEIIIDGQNISTLNEKKLTLYRRYDVGFVFQFYNVIPNLTALENIEIATEIGKNPLSPLQTLTDVGLENRQFNFPGQLSGGEQQRVAIARALAKNPKILLCDEPTGALDYETGKLVLNLIHKTAKLNNKTVIMVTHNQAIKSMGDRVIYVKNGKIDLIEENKNPQPIEEIEW